MMDRKTTTRKTTATKRPKLDTGGRPKGKGKGGVVTQCDALAQGRRRDEDHAHHEAEGAHCREARRHHAGFGR
jgi:hypothetical protein